MASSNGDFSRATEVSPALPDPALPDADWADAFEVVTQNASLSIMEIAERTAGTTPAWARHLMQLRNLVVARIGLSRENEQQSQRVARQLWCNAITLLERSTSL